MSVVADIIKLVNRARAIPGENIAFFSATLNLARRNTWGEILNAYDRRWADKQLNSINTLDMSMAFSNGSWFRCYGLNHLDPIPVHHFSAIYLDASVSESDRALIVSWAKGVPPVSSDAPMPRPVFGL